jgi:hypothetical protein
VTLDRALLLVQAAAYLTGLPAVGSIRWRPPELSGAWAWTGLTFLGPVWASTAFVQVPLYEALERRPDPDAGGQQLVRTLCWTARAALLGWAMVRLIGQGEVRAAGGRWRSAPGVG